MPGVSPERKPSAARDIYAFGITSLLNDTASEMAYWVLPAFLASLGAGPTQLGLIEGVAERGQFMSSKDGLHMGIAAGSTEGSHFVVQSLPVAGQHMGTRNNNIDFARSRLDVAIRRAGCDDVIFEYEPVAAAYDYAGRIERLLAAYRRWFHAGS